MQSVDGSFPEILLNILRLTLGLMVYYATAVYMTGWIALMVGALVFGLGTVLGNIYLKAQLSVRRETSNAKAPIMSQLGTTLAGLGKYC